MVHIHLIQAAMLALATARKLLPQENMMYQTVWYCGIVIDPNGRDYISDVYGDVYYPAGVSLGSYHKDPVTGQLREVKTCSGEMVRECKMTKLSQDKAMNLFCTKIRSNNNNLPTFAPGYGYDKICDEAAAGVLVKETAYAYCCNFTMSYEDPAGNYTVNVWGTDIAGTMVILYQTQCSIYKAKRLMLILPALITAV